MEPFLGEIRMFAGNFAPQGWHFCDGTLLDIATNDALFSLLGTTYGGDGQVNFGLPDLRGRVPLHAGPNYTLGENGGVESVALTVAQMPAHRHQYFASQNDATSPLGGSNLVGTAATGEVFRVTTASAGFSPQAIGAAGGSQPHDNLQPYQCINYIIALEGVFPPQS